MKKKNIEEFGILITREMRAMMIDEHLTYEQRAKIFCAIVGDESTGDVMMDAFSESLKVGYILTNNKRKMEIASRRERQKAYQRNLRASTEIYKDRHTSTAISKDRRASLNRTKQNSIYISPLNPPLAGGTGENAPCAISVEDILGEPSSGQPTETGGAVDLKESALGLAVAIENTEAFGHMRVNRSKLMKSIVSILKKNGAPIEDTVDSVLRGLADWSEAWRADEWRFVPGRITDWLYDGKYLETPRKKTAAAEHDYGEVGVKEIV